MPRKKKATKRSKKSTDTRKKRDYVDVTVIVWDDAHAAHRQDQIKNFGNGFKIISAGITVNPGSEKSREYVSMVTDIMPEIDEVRDWHNIPKAIVKKVKKVRVYL